MNVCVTSLLSTWPILEIKDLLFFMIYKILENIVKNSKKIVKKETFTFDCYNIAIYKKSMTKNICIV